MTASTNNPTARLTELQAINQMLAAVGQIPVTSIDTDSNDNPTNPDVAMALETLRQVSKEVQSEGWTFNREYNYPVNPNTDDEIVIPNNVLQMDLCLDYYNNRGKDAIRRNNKLYDKINHTFKWEGEQRVDILWYFDWEDLPSPIVDYIVNKSAAVFAQRIIGDSNLYQTLIGRAAESKAYALEYETQQGDYTFFGHPTGGNYYNSYQPFNALYR